MFKKDYIFHGIHAKKVNELTAIFDENSRSKLFNRNVDVYIIAPIVGFMYGNKSEIDRSIPDTAKILTEQLVREYETLKYHYQLIMLLDKENESSFEKRIDIAFRDFGINPNDKDKLAFNKFVLGGVDKLHEKLIGSATNTEDYFDNLYDFLEDFEERYNEEDTKNSVLELCKLAKSY